ncbi:4Fe-4S dicluster domain-containing protein [Flaviflexus huanghaiensis]|uniref:4Fe-4S dicluster domain-containing protein n=1 Tax=Flaviflexus huanghaiensis TaxID=1111473 RepID=UPI0015F82889|nr:4Fe-4S binding protein [Flaviflexus huanghaiensis]
MTSLRLLHSWLRANEPGPIALIAAGEPELVAEKKIPAVLLGTPLADVPSHELLEALGLGATIVYLHGDPGPLGSLMAILEGAGIERIRLGTAAVKPRESFGVDDVPHSRRDLFGLGRSDLPLPDESLLPEDRERLALRGVVDAEGVDPAVFADVPSHGLILRTSGCTACGVCVKACPTDALELSHLETGPDRRITTLAVYDSQCIGCRKCVDLCPVNAFTVAGPTSWETRLGDSSRRPLETIPTVKCERCKTFFPMREGGTLCATCRATRENPFGIRWPEGVPKPPGARF